MSKKNKSPSQAKPLLLSEFNPVCIDFLEILKESSEKKFSLSEFEKALFSIKISETQNSYAQQLSSQRIKLFAAATTSGTFIFSLFSLGNRILNTPIWPITWLFLLYQFNCWAIHISMALLLPTSKQAFTQSAPTLRSEFLLAYQERGQSEEDFFRALVNETKEWNQTYHLFFQSLSQGVPRFLGSLLLYTVPSFLFPKIAETLENYSPIMAAAYLALAPLYWQTPIDFSVFQANLYEQLFLIPLSQKSEELKTKWIKETAEKILATHETPSISEIKLKGTLGQIFLMLEAHNITLQNYLWVFLSSCASIGTAAYFGQNLVSMLFLDTGLFLLFNLCGSIISEQFNFFSLQSTKNLLNTFFGDKIPNLIELLDFKKKLKNTLGHGQDFKASILAPCAVTILMQTVLFFSCILLEKFTPFKALENFIQKPKIYFGLHTLTSALVYQGLSSALKQSFSNLVVNHEETPKAQDSPIDAIDNTSTTDPQVLRESFNRLKERHTPRKLSGPGIQSILFQQRDSRRILSEETGSKPA